jgi:histidine phosphotransferase ChpT
MAIDLRVAKLLCSRLCHDLISPASAVNAGLELMEEQPGNDDAQDLIARSAKQVTRRLAFYRSAFGAGGVTTLTEARDLAAGLLADGNVVLDWPGDEGGPVSTVGAAMLLNLILVAVDTLPRGGAVSVRLAVLDEGIGAALTTSGDGARLGEEMSRAIGPDMDEAELSVGNVPAYLVRRLADDAGVSVEITDGADGEVRLAALLPAAE